MNSSHDILHAILAARRLLSEHVDILHLLTEDVTRASSQKKVTLNKLSVVRSALWTVASISTAAICLRKLLTLPNSSAIAMVATLTSTSTSIYSMRQLRQQLLHGTQLRNVLRLLHQIDHFDRVLRQHIKYFREFQSLLGPTNDTQKIRQLKIYNEANATVTAAMPVIWATYAAIQRLEVLPLSHEYDDVYLPTEPLDNCELFTRTSGVFSAQNIREVQEIFQFLQSQLLVRLGLATVYNTVEATEFIACNVPRLCDTIQAQLNVYAEQQEMLTQRQEIKQKLDAIRSVHNHTTEPSSLISLRNGSLDLLARMMALTEDLRYVEQIFQSTKNVQDAEFRSMDGDLERFGERLDLCCDEYRRMLCVYRRAVHTRTAEPTSDNGALAIANFSESTPPVCVFDEVASDAVPEAEFYALIDREDEDSEHLIGDSDSKTNAANSLEAELKELDAKVVKHQFRPVLRQLKNRLEPINEAMRDRERKFCEEKGISLEVPDNEGGLVVDDSASGDTDAKPSTHRDMYADMRQFLQDKQPISFLPMLGFPASHTKLEEEILE